MSTAQEEQATEAVVPVSFRVSTYWKLGKGQHGLTHVDSRRLALSEALDMLLEQLTDGEAVIETVGEVTTVVIDWSKVPGEIRNPFQFGVKR